MSDQKNVHYEYFKDLMDSSLSIEEIKEFIECHEKMLNNRKVKDVIYQNYWISLVEARNALIAKTLGYTFNDF